MYCKRKNFPRYPLVSWHVNRQLGPMCLVHSHNTPQLATIFARKLGSRLVGYVKFGAATTRQSMLVQFVCRSSPRMWLTNRPPHLRSDQSLGAACFGSVRTEPKFPPKFYLVISTIFLTNVFTRGCFFFPFNCPLSSTTTTADCKWTQIGCWPILPTTTLAFNGNLIFARDMGVHASPVEHQTIVHNKQSQSFENVAVPQIIGRIAIILWFLPKQYHFQDFYETLILSSIKNH